MKPRFTQRAHEKDINALAVSPNDKLFASGSQDKTIKIWNTHDLTVATTLKGHKRGVWSLEFSKVDKILASSSGDKTIRLWSMTDYTCLKVFFHLNNEILFICFNSTDFRRSYQFCIESFFYYKWNAVSFEWFRWFN